MSRRIGIVAIYPLLMLGNLLAGSGQSGAPGDGTCADCHGVSKTPLASTANGNGVFMTFSGGTTYTPGMTQTVTVTVVDTAFPQFGFQTSPRIQGQDATAGAGTLIPVDAGAQFYPPMPPSTLSWIAAGEAAGSTTNVFHFKWTPPASGTVVFYMIGMGANGVAPAPTEHVYANRYVLTQAAPPPPLPTISANRVVSAAANVPGLTPGAWIAIYGKNFAPTAENWSDADFTSGKLPAALGGVSVTIDGKPAAVYYVAPGQIDAQVPDDTATGPVNVVVTSGTSKSDPAIVNMAAFAPSFFMSDAKYVAATHADGSLVNTASPAKPGEVVVVYGTGFGPTNPPTPAGQVVSTANPLASPNTLMILIGGSQAQIAFAGVTAAGLDQFNLTVPATLPDGDATVSGTIGSVSTQSGAFLPVHQ